MIPQNQDIDIRQLLPTGSVLQGGKYRVDRYLSSGNFGNTYIVTNTGMQVQFAMKEFFLRNICYRTNQGAAVSVSPAVDPEKVDIQRQKFKKEAQRLYGLTSKHLVHVHDMFEENGTVYYVMDFVKGESLAHYMERQGRALTEEQVRYILDQLLDGLDEIHQKQIWHLDLKPDNIMIDRDGKVVIIDFGASKQVGRSGKYTGTSNILCYTPGYAPTEQVNQNLEAVGPWTDIYALGATLYNLLTNIDPSTQNGKPLQFPSQVSPAMRRLITKMMSADIASRPQTIAEVRQLLTADGGSTADGKVHISKRWLAIGAAAVVALVVGAVLLFGGGGENKQVAQKAEEDVLEQVAEETEEQAEQKEEVQEQPVDDNLSDQREQQLAEQQKQLEERERQLAEQQQKIEQQQREQEEAARKAEADRKAKEEAAKQQQASSSLSPVLQRLIKIMVYVQGGTFTMGATAAQESEAYDGEKPAHQVTLSSFSIGKYEVTQEEWEAVMGNNPSYFKGAKRPVENVSWNDCQDFIRELNRLTGKRFRLPTEAEWEFAARGGNRGKDYDNKYAGSSSIGSVAWYDGNSGSQTHNVGQKSANELGLYDMTGNVWEWCQDWYGSYSSGAQTNPKGPSSGSGRVNRGGSWVNIAWGCRVANRDGNLPSYSGSNLGFRLAL